MRSQHLLELTRGLRARPAPWWVAEVTQRHHRDIDDNARRDDRLLADAADDGKDQEQHAHGKQPSHTPRAAKSCDPRCIKDVSYGGEQAADDLLERQALRRIKFGVEIVGNGGGTASHTCIIGAQPAIGKCNTVDAGVQREAGTKPLLPPGSLYVGCWQKPTFSARPSGMPKASEPGSDGTSGLCIHWLHSRPCRRKIPGFAFALKKPFAMNSWKPVTGRTVLPRRSSGNSCGNMSPRQSWIADRRD